MNSESKLLEKIAENTGKARKEPDAMPGTEPAAPLTVRQPAGAGRRHDNEYFKHRRRHLGSSTTSSTRSISREPETINRSAATSRHKVVERIYDRSLDQRAGPGGPWPKNEPKYAAWKEQELRRRRAEQPHRPDALSPIALSAERRSTPSRSR